MVSVVHSVFLLSGVFNPGASYGMVGMTVACSLLGYRGLDNEEFPLRSSARLKLKYLSISLDTGQQPCELYLSSKPRAYGEYGETPNGA